MKDENMTGERLEEPRPKTREPENSREYLWRVLKPAGCILVLVILVLYLVFCFTYKNDPLAEASAPPQTEQTSK